MMSREQRAGAAAVVSMLCLVLCAALCRGSACVRCIFDACCRKWGLLFRNVVPYCSAAAA